MKKSGLDPGYAKIIFLNKIFLNTAKTVISMHREYVLLYSTVQH